jgi:hypothetical protein
MNEKVENKIDELRKEMDRLNKELDDCQREMDEIIVGNGGDFKDSYVVYYDGEDYTFMKVEYQNIRNHGKSINLQGPSLTLPFNPLDGETDNDGDSVYTTYDEHNGFSFGASVLNETALEVVRKITKEEMSKVVKFHNKMVEKRLL